MGWKDDEVVDQSAPVAGPWDKDEVVDERDPRDIQAARIGGGRSSAIQAQNARTPGQSMIETAQAVGKASADPTQAGLTTPDAGIDAARGTEFGRGIETGVYGAGQIAAGLKMFESTQAGRTAKDNLRAMQAVDEGKDWRTSLGQHADTSFAQMYASSDPGGRTKLRDQVVGQLAQSKDTQQAAVTAWKEYQDKIEKTSGRTPNLTDVNDVKSFGDWLAFNSGQGAVYIVPMMLTALTTGPLGLGVASYAMGLGDLTQNRMQNTIQAAPNLAMGGQQAEQQTPSSAPEAQRVGADIERAGPTTALLAAPYAALDVALGPSAKLAAGGVMKAIGKRIAERGIEGGIMAGVKSAGKEVAKQTSEEFINEGTQQFLQSLQDKILDDSALFTRENVKSWINAGAAGAAGALGPAGISVGAHVVGAKGAGKGKAAEPERASPSAEWKDAQAAFTPERSGAETVYVAPNGARITPEQWDSASTRVRQSWLTPAPGTETAAPAAPAAAAETPGGIPTQTAPTQAVDQRPIVGGIRVDEQLEAAPAPTQEAPPTLEAPEVEHIEAAPPPKQELTSPRLEHLERASASTLSPQIRNDLDKMIKVERDRLEKGQRAEEYVRLAAETQDPELKQQMLDKAIKIGGSNVEKIEALPPPTSEQVQNRSKWMTEHGLDEATAHEAAQIRAAAEIDPTVVKQAAQTNQDNHPRFMRVVQEVLNASAEPGATSTSQTRPGPEQGLPSRARNAPGRVPAVEGRAATQAVAKPAEAAAVREDRVRNQPGGGPAQAVAGPKVGPEVRVTRAQRTGEAGPVAPAPTKPQSATKLKLAERSESLGETFKNHKVDLQETSEDNRSIPAIRRSQARAARKIIEEHGGKAVFFTHGEGDKLFHGFSSASDPNTVYIALDQQDPVLAVAGHEFGHWLEKNHPDLHESFVKDVMPSLKGIDQHERTLAAQYKRKGSLPLSQRGALNELISDVWAHMFTDPKFHEEVAQRNPSFYRRIADALIKFINTTLAKLKSDPMEVRQYIDHLDNARKIAVDTMAKLQTRVAEERTSQIKRATTLTAEQRAIETRFADRIEGDVARATRDYGKLKDSDGGKILNTDVARELSPDYLADRTQSAAVHEPASWLIKQMYAQKLAEAPKAGESPLVLFTAGGTGAGKSSSIESVPGVHNLAQKAQIVYDTNMNGYDGAKQKVDQALAAGKSVSIVLVARDPVDALVGGALPRAMRQEAQFGSGRTVPVEEHIKTHIGATEVVKRLAAEYADNPQVKITAIDNSRGNGNAREIELSAVPDLPYNETARRVRDALEAERAAGRISEQVYAGFKGTEARPQGVGQDTGPPGRAHGLAGEQSQQEGAGGKTGPPSTTAAQDLARLKIAGNADRRSSIALRTGEEKLKTRDNSTRAVAEALEARTRKLGAIDRNDVSDKAREKIARALADEVEYEVAGKAQGKSGVGWYSQNYPRAVRRLGAVFPELYDSQPHRDLFTALIATFSNGQAVPTNARMALQAYEAITRGGRRLTDVADLGANRDTIHALEGLQQVYQDYGIKGARDYLLEDVSVKDMNAQLRKMGLKVPTDYPVDMTVPRAALVMGPKIGAFYANLMGSHGYLTMDRWWTRSFNRLRGSLIPWPTESGLNNLRSLLEQEQGHSYKNIDDDNVIIAAVPYWHDYAQRKYKNGTPLEKAANTIMKDAAIELEDAPLTAAERRFMVQAAERTQEILAERGYNLTIADIQAAEWYYEKKLYAELGARDSGTIGYEEAIDQHAKDRAPDDRPARSVDELVHQGTRQAGAESSRSVEQADAAEGEAAGRGQVPDVGELVQYSLANSPLAQLEGERKLERYWFDRFNRLLQAEEALAKVAAPATDKESVRLAEKEFHGRAQNEGEKLERDYVKPLGKELQAAKKMGLSIRDADDYLMALHAPERNATLKARDPQGRNGLSGLTDQQANQIVASFTPEQVTQLNKIRDIVHSMTKANLDRLVNAGLITQQTRSQLRKQWKNYVPLKTLEEESRMLGTGRGYEMWGTDIKTAFGRASKAGSPIASTIIDSSRAIIRSEKARVEQSLWNLSQRPEMHDIMREYDPDNPPPQVMTKEMDPKTGQWKEVVSHSKLQEHTMHLMINGEPRRLFIPDELLMQQLRKAGEFESLPRVVEGIARVTRTMGRTLTEWNPSFTFPNAFKDGIAAVIRARGIEGMSAARVALGIPKAWAAIVQEKRGKVTGVGKSYETYKELGGKTGAYGILGAKEALQHLQDLGAELGYPQGAAETVLRKAAVPLQKLLHLMSAANEVLEYATRLSAFNEARRAGYSDARATEIGKEITVNFNRSGELAKPLNSLFVFFNAALQGLYATKEFAMNRNRVIEPGVTSGKATRRAVYALAAIGLIMQAMNEWLPGKDDDTDEDYDKSISDFTQDSNLMFMLPEALRDKLGLGGFKIPLPPEYKFAYAIGRRFYRGMSRGNWLDESAGMAGALMDSILPVRVAEGGQSGLPGQAVKAVSVTPVLPFIEIMANENFLGQQIVPDQKPGQAAQPYYKIAKRSTADVAKTVSQFANDITGGDQIEPGASQRTLGKFSSPEAIQHVVGSYTGGLGQLAMQSSNIVKGVAGDTEALDVNRAPIVSRFAFAQTKGYPSKRYHELANGSGGYKYALQREKANQEITDPAIAATLGFYRSTEEQLRKIYPLLRTAEDLGDDDLAKDLQEQITAAQKGVIRAYSEAKRVTAD